MAALGLLLLARLEVGSAKVGVKDADVAAKRASAAAGVEVGAPRVRRVDDEGLKVVQRGHEAAELARGPHEQRLEPRPVLHVLGCLVVVGAVGAADKGARRDRGIDVAVRREADGARAVAERLQVGLDRRHDLLERHPLVSDQDEPRLQNVRVERAQLGDKLLQEIRVELHEVLQKRELCTATLPGNSSVGTLARGTRRVQTVQESGGSGPAIEGINQFYFRLV